MDIRILRPLDQPHWHAVRAFNTTIAPQNMIADRIAEKNDRVKEYKLSASEVWLLIVNNRFLGPGEVHVLPSHLAQWKFTFDFGKVLVFLREADGAGEVIEISARMISPAHMRPLAHGSFCKTFLWPTSKLLLRG